VGRYHIPPHFYKIKGGDILNIKLYKNHSPSNYVNKHLTDEITIENVRFKEDNFLDIKHPRLLVNQWQDVENANGYNYLYIPKFNSYYYIDSISWTGSLADIQTLKRDVLMTFKEDILASVQYVTRQENRTNKYIVDNMLPIHSDHYYKVEQFGDDVGDITCNHVILETAGRLGGA
jgi:hypothetical protein